MKLEEMKNKREHWRKMAEYVLEGGAVGEYNGDPDSNVMELARAVQRLLDERSKLLAVAKVAKLGVQRQVGWIDIEMAIAALETENDA